MRKRLYICLPLLAAGLAIVCWPRLTACGQQASSADNAGAKQGERVVLTIGDQKITAAEVDEFIHSLPPQYQSFYGGPGKHVLPQYIIAMKVLSAEALKLKLQDQPAVGRAIETAREGILADAARKYFAQSISISDQEIRTRYDQDKTKSEEVRIGHILIRTDNAPLGPGVPGNPPLPEPEARTKLEDIRKQILAGADFAQIAKQYSQDPDTAAHGGDMGVLNPEKVVPAVVNAAHTLEPGQVSGIIQTPSGLEIIKVEQKRDKSFEEVKPALETELRESKASETVRHIMDNYHVVIDQDYFAASPSQGSAPPARATH